MKYTYKRTLIDFPWRYFVYEGNVAITLTFTKWGAERLIKKLKEQS